jgi:hypothetical protein
MFRSMSRTAIVTVVALTLVLASVPAAQASPFGTGPSLDTRAGWFDVALSWLSGLLFGEETSSPQPTGSAFEAANTTSSIGDFATPLAGSCLDPAGSPRCNL